MRLGPLIERGAGVTINCLGVVQDVVVSERSNGIQVVARAIDILRSLRESPGGLAQAEIGARLDLPRTTVSRILGALEAEQLVTTTGSRGRYRLGPEIARLAHAMTRDLVVLIRPYIVELSKTLTETVDLSMLDDSVVTFVDQVDAPHRLRAASAVGESFPLHTCAPGKAFLAMMEDAQRARVLPKSLVASTHSSLTTRDELERQLEQIRSTGVAYNYEEQNDGICAAGVAMNVAGTLLAISVPVPTQRFQGREQEIADALIRIRDRILAEPWA